MVILNNFRRKNIGDFEQFSSEKILAILNIFGEITGEVNGDWTVTVLLYVQNVQRNFFWISKFGA
jgi:hypothetical protein